MKEFIFNNNAKEQFHFFKNEVNETCLNFSHEKELKACFILSSGELENLKSFLNEDSKTLEYLKYAISLLEETTEFEVLESYQEKVKMLKDLTK